MTGTEYQKLAMRTNRDDASTHDNLINGCLGLAGESGEVCDYIKKHIFQGHEFEIDHIVEELGDCMWYIALMATAVGTTMEEIMERNIEKLKKRYPDGFSVMNSINRTE